MPPSSDTAALDRTLARATAALRRERSPFRELPERLIVVDVARQRLVWVERGRAVADYPISTAATGIGSAAGSFMTPPGWHRIHCRIGAGAEAGAVFESREPTGEAWRGEPRNEDLILTRILTLEGLEDAVNRGAGVDSLERYIYIHGSNHENAIGRPTSHGCVRMTNADVIVLFDRVREGDPVLILEGDDGARP